MPFRETVAVYCENHTEHTNTLCGQNAEYVNVRAGGIYSNHCVLSL
jgi:translation initiation factor IF-1